METQDVDGISISPASSRQLRCISPLMTVGWDDVVEIRITRITRMYDMRFPTFVGLGTPCSYFNIAQNEGLNGDQEAREMNTSADNDHIYFTRAYQRFIAYSTFERGRKAHPFTIDMMRFGNDFDLPVDGPSACVGNLRANMGEQAYCPIGCPNDISSWLSVKNRDLCRILSRPPQASYFFKYIPLVPTDETCFRDLCLVPTEKSKLALDLPPLTR